MTKAPKHFIQIPVITARQKDISSTDKLVFGEIYTMLNTTDKFWMTNTGIGQRISKNKSSVRKSIKRLKKLGYIKTKCIPTGKELSKRFVYDAQLGGAKNGHTKIGGAKNGVSVRPNKDSQPDQKLTPNKSINKSTNRLVSIKTKIIKDLEAMMVAINTFVSQDIDNWLNTYDPKLILKALHMVGTRNPNPRYVITDVTTLLQNGCKTYQPKRHVNYGHQPIKRQLPDWAKKGYHQKLHPTSKKDQLRIKKQLKDLNNRGDKK